MTDRTRSDFVPPRYEPGWFGPQVRFITLIVCLIVILGISVGGYFYGRYLAARESGGRDTAIEQLQSEGQKLKRSVDNKSAQITALQTKLANTQAALNAIMPSANIYNLNPNQTLNVADGRVTVGLVGSPGNEGITLNINGKQQTVSAGQVIVVAPDSATNCRLAVQSFDMFKAVINASCAAAQPH